MSIEITTALLATSTLEVAQSVWKLLPERLKEKGVEDFPITVVALKRATPRRGC